MPPSDLLDTLRAFRRRVRLLGLAYGSGVVLAAIVGALLGTIALDYLLDLHPIPRLVVILIAFGAIVWTLLRYLVHPSMSRLKLGDVAGRIESSFPVFDDRLRSTIDFLTPGKTVAGSDAMKQRVIQQATELASRVKMEQVITARPAVSSLGGGIGAILFCLLLALLISPAYVHAAISRLLDPFGSNPWPRRTHIQLVGQLPPRFPSGQRLELSARLVKGDKPSAKPIVDYQYDSGAVQHELMTRNPDATYSANIDARTEPGRDTGDLHIWINCDDDSLALPLVQIVQPLSIRRVVADVRPPPYASDLPSSQLDLSTAAGTVTAGSPISLSITFNKPLDPQSAVSLEPLLKTESLPMIQWDKLPPSGSIATGHWVADQTVHFRIRAADADGFTNSAIEEYQLIVRPDRPPTIQFEKPTQNQDVTPQAIIPIQALAEDDFGVRTVQLMVKRDSDQKLWTIDLISSGKPASDAVAWQLVDATSDVRRFRMNWSWDISKLDSIPLKEGEQFEFYLRAQDNFQDANGRPHEPPYAESGHLRLTIISQETLVSQIMERLAALRDETNTIRQKNNGIRDATKGLHDDTQKQPTLTKADKVLVNQLNNDQSTTASQTQQVSSKLDELLDRLTENRSPNSDLANNIGQAQVLLNDASNNLMKDAMNHLSQVHDQPNQPPADRNNHFDQAQTNQTQASDKLQLAMDKMGTDTGVAQFMKRISDLLAAQQNVSAQTVAAGRTMLGKDPSQLTPTEKKTLSGLTDQQKDLQRQIDNAMKDMQDASDKQSKTDPDSSAALKQAVTTGQNQNVSGNMGQASQSISANQQSQAQSSQQQAELGLMMILKQLQEADNRRLMSLIKQLEDAQQLIADLIQQQSSHNLDDLALQGHAATAAIAKADPQLLSQLNEFAGRDMKNPPAPPTLPTLITLQAQTEHNTRNVVPVIQALPEGADPAAHLTRAAQMMSRAVSALQDNQLLDAYQPPQVQALDLLLQAKAAVDAQHDKAMEKLGEQQKESIRQAFIKIRDDQVKIDKQTVAIDAPPKTADGHLPHSAVATLGLLSGQQGDLAARAAKLDQDLINVGSIAYTYANKDIVTHMGQVKDQLAALNAGAGTQKTQVRIVRQLDAMIKELALKPKVSQFAGGGGGGGGTPPPRLPTEAEIRLIRDMQSDLNDDTADADANHADKQSVLNIGKRQGDMRNLLDQVLQKASNGQLKLGAEPANKASLPEEANPEDIDLQELKDAALNAKPDAQGEQDDTSLVGDRMARARQRLALNSDPGQTTQRIQQRILINLDALAEMARQQQAQGRPRPAPPGSKGGQADQGSARSVGANNTGKGAAAQGPKSGQGGSTPAGDSTNGGPGLTDQDINASIEALKNNWGTLSPRQRAAILEGASEKTLAQFKPYVDGYYRTLANKATQQ